MFLSLLTFKYNNKSRNLNQKQSQSAGLSQLLYVFRIIRISLRVLLLLSIYYYDSITLKECTLGVGVWRKRQYLFEGWRLPKSAPCIPSTLKRPLSDYANTPCGGGLMSCLSFGVAREGGSYTPAHRLISTAIHVQTEHGDAE